MVPAPPEQVSRGRRLEVSRGEDASKSAEKNDTFARFAFDVVVTWY